jgi:hypothetical protein
VKTNLDKLFKTNEELEKSGIVVVLSETLEFNLKRFGGKNSTPVRAAYAKYHKPYARQIEMGTFDKEKEREILIKIFVDSCMLGWKGVEIDGAPAEFSRENAVKLLIALPELFETLFEQASKVDNFKEDLGNS